MKEDLINEDVSEKASVWDKVLPVLFCLGAYLAGRTFGFLGIGAIAIGWFVYEGTKEKLGRFLALCASVACSFAVYGLAAIAIYAN
ncbi:MAG: hypothetical protein NZ811_08930 [Gammaproteobacteria bacterium]|nr:hypothetical protein [Gammaproteobacteria bacterium]